MCDELQTMWDAFGVFGTTVPEKIGVLHSRFPKLVPISPNAS
jgi:hypothetical protein